jgi:hypothetical protein
MRAPLTFQLPIIPINYAVNLDSCGDIHCALGPPSPFPLKIEEKEAYLQNLQRRAAFIAPFTSEE